MKKTDIIWIAAIITLLLLASYKTGVWWGSKGSPGVQIENTGGGVAETESPGEGVEWTLFDVSFYCASCSTCVDRRYRDGKTASGKKIRFGYVASGRVYPFGTRIEFERPVLGRKVYQVEDRGRVIHGRKLDIFISQEQGGHARAKRLGRQQLFGRVN